MVLIVAAWTVPPALTLEERSTIDAWLFCIECTPSHLDSVVALCRRKSAAVDTLARDLLAGLTGTRRLNLQTQFAATHRDLSREAAAQGMATGQPESLYVASALLNANTLTRSRAAIALATFGGATARIPLDAAIDSIFAASPRFVEPLASRVRFARDSIWHPLPTDP